MLLDFMVDPAIFKLGSWAVLTVELATMDRYRCLSELDMCPSLRSKKKNRQHIIFK